MWIGMKKSSDKLVLVDFDGTITRKDVGALLFNTYSNQRSRKIVSLWLKGKIGSKECLEKECELIKISKPELKKFAFSQKIDERFPSFVDLCKRKKLKLLILSDGLDFYIKLILQKYGLEEVPFYANIARFENGKLVPEFPHFDRGCGNCGNCKRYHLESLKRKGQKVIYIGDGLSDKCAAQKADLIFAKNDLHKFCVKENIKHIPFRNFRDIIDIFRQVII